MEMLNAEDAANLIGMSASWLAKARMNKQGPQFIKIGKSVRYRLDDVIRWLEANTINTA